ncbi:hypothetical protein G7050_00055 [Dysgonomonas sp. HDW5A]|uniref:hypothetical protein n=1 Tax=Dysgonomonas sp. HDW5A TaxID=2714926 RepID=UPI00140D3E1C|nr:hypothetical protein [Dysgonomonas sp. HDW5A]QIK58312.1 hypothetical protein G7050_00055 [Dysgonomonas sp. HDW5A]
MRGFIRGTGFLCICKILVFSGLNFKFIFPRPGPEAKCGEIQSLDVTRYQLMFYIAPYFIILLRYAFYCHNPILQKNNTLQSFLNN